MNRYGVYYIADPDGLQILWNLLPLFTSFIPKIGVLYFIVQDMRNGMIIRMNEGGVFMTDEEIKKRIQEAFGYSDEQLLLEFEKAEKEMKEKAVSEKNNSSGDYETLKRKIEEYETLRNGGKMKVCDATRARIKELCREKNTIEYMLVYHSEMPPSTIKNILYGQSRNPGIVTIQKISEFFGISIREFYNSPLFDELEPED